MSQHILQAAGFCCRKWKESLLLLHAMQRTSRKSSVCGNSRNMQKSLPERNKIINPRISPRLFRSHGCYKSIEHNTQCHTARSWSFCTCSVAWRKTKTGFCTPYTDQDFNVGLQLNHGKRHPWMLKLGTEWSLQTASIFDLRRQSGFLFCCNSFSEKKSGKLLLWTSIFCLFCLAYQDIPIFPSAGAKTCM